MNLSPLVPARRRALSCAAAVLLAGAGSAAWAVEYGSVVSSVPVNAQVQTPQQQCVDEQQLVQRPNTGGGAVLGAVIGGVLGNTIGSGVGRAAATGIGAVVGAGVGDNVEAAGTPPAALTTRRCSTVTRYETRVIGYDTVYEYQGQRYVTRLAQPPGDRIALNVSVAPADGAVGVPQPAYSTYPQAPGGSGDAQTAAGTTTTVVEPATTTVYPATTTVYPATAVYPATTVYPAYYGGYGYPYGWGGGYYSGAVIAPRLVIGVGGGGYWGRGWGGGRRWR